MIIEELKPGDVFILENVYYLKVAKTTAIATPHPQLAVNLKTFGVEYFPSNIEVVHQVAQILVEIIPNLL